MIWNYPPPSSIIHMAKHMGLMIPGKYISQSHWFRYFISSFNLCRCKRVQVSPAHSLAVHCQGKTLQAATNIAKQNQPKLPTKRWHGTIQKNWTTSIEFLPSQSGWDGDTTRIWLPRICITQALVNDRGYAHKPFLWCEIWQAGLHVHLIVVDLTLEKRSLILKVCHSVP